ncbi:hypothetical protein [uncultured Gemmiger sp.]|uniref:hypothetical protein n=1 Tax=uncultured Gemmiger sp. TaxID=1623490 RepID=UPI0025ED95FE|nr:hypothetical protein [uncultured Gemmiger sp.]
MGKRIAPGDRIPFFQYDTPYSAQNSFRELLKQNAPLVLVFMSNFGHPVTRTFVSRYSHTRYKLTDGGFAMVVRSYPEKLAENIGPNSLPYPLLCDAEGVLYDLLAIPSKTGFWRTCSLEAWRILKKARRRGYVMPAHQPQQMPLTLILDADGTVLFSHYGSSLTDVPEDCGAMQNLLAELDLLPEEPEDAAEDFETDGYEEYGEEDDGYDEAPAEPEDYDPDADDFADVPDDSDVREYNSPKLSHTMLLGLLDDPYQDD